MKKIFFALLSVITFLTSCEEDIDLNIASSEPKIVIEGEIENGKFAQVMVTRNSPLTQAVNFSNILVTNAQVYVSNGVITDTLVFDTIFNASNPFCYVGNSVIGIPGQTYFLTVIADGKTYTATTTIPAPIALDSVWWQPQPPKDSLGFAWATLSDPTGVGNGYRWQVKRPTKFVMFEGNPLILDRRYIAPGGATFDDKFIDGKTFDFAYFRPTDPTEAAYYEDEPEEERGYYKYGDTIYIRFSTLDKASQDFYKTYEAAMSSNGNPFASPVTILSNIQGGGLGVWAGMGCSYDTIYAQ
ncbi:MAG: DUF4249 domain-containing protein [Bacteroidia bacterium]|nr:DUF4249 domain-containing protein [Bacteroidia bacterium]